MTLLNPIIKKELEVRSRGHSLPAVLIVINSILFIAGLTGTFALVARMKQSGQIYFRSFLGIYMFVAALEYALILFIAPLFTAPSISGERETGTFDLLLTTRLTPADIVLEKTLSALASMAAIIISCLPALIVPLIFGGISLTDAIGLLLLFLPGTFLVLSLGIFAGSIGKSVTASIASAYALTLFITFGFAALPFMTRIFAASDNNYAAWLLVLDPFTTVGAALSSQLGKEEFIENVFLLMEFRPETGLTEHIVLISAMLQAALGIGFVMAAIINVMPGRYRELRRDGPVLKKGQQL